MLEAAQIAVRACRADRRGEARKHRAIAIVDERTPEPIERGDAGGGDLPRGAGRVEAEERSERGSGDVEPRCRVGRMIDEVEGGEHELDGRRIGERLAPLGAGHDAISLQFRDHQFCRLVRADEDSHRFSRVGPGEYRGPRRHGGEEERGSLLPLLGSGTGAQSHPAWEGFTGGLVARKLAACQGSDTGMIGEWLRPGEPLEDPVDGVEDGGARAIAGGEVE